MNKFILISILTLFPTIIQAIDLEKFKARPDQVLVIYNNDWIKDTDGSEPVQDSLEVAEYYVRRHTDSESNLRPYSMGLSCVHQQKHLNHWYIKEKSQDNKNGVVFKGKGLSPGEKEWARDSRHVEIVVHNKDGNVDWDSARIWCASLLSKEKFEVTPQISGIPIKQGRQWVYPPAENSNGRCFRFDAHKLFTGTITVYFELRDNTGNKIRDLKLRYYDKDDFEFSMRGKDGIVDEKHFQEDVAIPVKQFLEDPKNALPDGTLLKNHILYIVVCHGLPYSCEGVFGIERGATENSGGHGDLGSLEQRLQTLYYGWGTTIRPPVISMYMNGGPDSKSGVRNYRITSAMRFPMGGKQWNVYMHPDTYSYLRKKKEPINEYQIPPFPEQRKNLPSYYFGYGVSRVDGQGPLEAKRQVDYALYASKYLRPQIIRDYDSGSATAKNKSSQKFTVKDIYKGSEWGLPKVPALGYETKTGKRDHGIPFLKLTRDQSQNRFQYLPGGIDRVVTSANGWNGHRDGPIWKQVENGVTISACGGPAYGGGPHITNATFWDNRILMRYLFRGRDLGECFLLSTYYVNWSTSLIGDPLYHPDLSRTIVDDLPPAVFSKDDIQVNVIPTMDKYAAVITCPIQFGKKNPELALLEARVVKTGEKVEKSHFSSIFSARPRVVLRRLEKDTVYLVRLILTDPYGNSTDLSDTYGLVVLDTSSRENRKNSVWQHINNIKNQWSIQFRNENEFIEQGTIKIIFEAGVDGLLPSIVSKDLYFRSKNHGSKGKSIISLKLAGPERRRIITSPFQGGEKATMLMRWRRHPLTREILILADDGTEQPLIADVRTPWEETEAPGSIKITEGKGINVISVSYIDDADVFSEKSNGVELPQLN